MARCFSDAGQTLAPRSQSHRFFSNFLNSWGRSQSRQREEENQEELEREYVPESIAVGWLFWGWKLMAGVEMEPATSGSSQTPLWMFPWCLHLGWIILAAGWPELGEQVLAAYRSSLMLLAPGFFARLGQCCKGLGLGPRATELEARYGL